MSKTTKLWISHELELRHAINGWPEEPQMSFGDYNPSEQKLYLDELAQAKAESILVVNYELPINEGIPGGFIEIEGEVEVGYQWKNTNPGGHGWINVSEKECLRFKEAGYDTRQVARLVKADSGAHSFTEAQVVLGSTGDGPSLGADGKKHYIPKNEIKPINPHVAIGWQAPDLNNTGTGAVEFLHRDEVKSLMEIARQDATRGLKDRILKEFNHAWHTDGSRYPDPEVTLQIVLDILGVK